MKIGNFKIGKYHGIIKKFYDEGTIEYETDFYSEDDINCSVSALIRCTGKQVGIGYTNPKVLKNITVITGLENIKAELTNPQNLENLAVWER